MSGFVFGVQQQTILLQRNSWYYGSGLDKKTATAGRDERKRETKAASRITGANREGGEIKPTHHIATPRDLLRACFQITAIGVLNALRSGLKVVLDVPILVVHDTKVEVIKTQ